MELLGKMMAIVLLSAGITGLIYGITRLIQTHMGEGG